MMTMIVGDNGDDDDGLIMFDDDSYNNDIGDVNTVCSLNLHPRRDKAPKK